jgi:type I restriction enzyme S subunit
MRGVNHPRTSWSSISDFTFSLPILTEQDAIVAALDAIQDAIGALRHEAALERERKAALMHHLFTRGTRGEPRKQTEIGEMPEGWQIAALNSVSEIAYGLTVNKARRISSRLAPYLTVANVTRGALRLGDIKQIGMLSSDSESYRLRYGDVLFVEGSGNPELLGSAAVWNDELPFALHQNHLIRARPDQHAVLPLWIMSYFNSASGRAQLLGRATTSSGLHNINSRLLGSLLLPVPPMAEQFTIIRVYESCDARIIGLEHEVATLRELFDTMLNDLMTGRLPVHPCSP